MLCWEWMSGWIVSAQLWSLVCVWHARAVKSLPSFCLRVCVFWIGEGRLLVCFVLADSGRLAMASVPRFLREAYTQTHIYLDTCSFAVSPVSVSCALLHKVCLSIFSFSHLFLLCLSSFHPPTHPSVFLSPVLCALCPVLFNSSFLLYSMESTKVLLFLL